MLKIAPEPWTALGDRFASVRALSLALVAPLSDADASVQSMPDASPTKWHLAHTTWFFETFVLRDHVADYRLHDARFPFLFNSYYEAEGRRHARDRRGMITRPTLDEVRAYRAHVDAALMTALPDLPDDALELVALGCHHEEQHQELLVTDILYLFGENPLEPAIWPAAPKVPVAMPGPVGWIEHGGGIVRIGHDGDQRRMGGVHRRRRLSRSEPLAGRWLGMGQGGRHRRAALLGRPRRGLDPVWPRWPSPD
jgi:hypothetical protein